MRPASRTYLSSSETSRSEPRREPPLSPERTKRCPWEGRLRGAAPLRTAIDIPVLPFPRGRIGKHNLPLVADGSHHELESLADGLGIRSRSMTIATQHEPRI